MTRENCDPPDSIDCFVCGKRVLVEKTAHGLCCLECEPEARKQCDSESAFWSDELEWGDEEWRVYAIWRSHAA